MRRSGVNSGNSRNTTASSRDQYYRTHLADCIIGAGDYGTSCPRIWRSTKTGSFYTCPREVPKFRSWKNPEGSDGPSLDVDAGSIHPQLALTRSVFPECPPPMANLEEVFRLSGIPTYTFV